MKYSLLLMTAVVSTLAVSCSGKANNPAPQAAVPAAPVAAPVAAQPAVAAPAAAPAPAPAAPVAAPAPATRPYSAGHATLYVTTRSGGPLNLRASASTGATVVASLPHGSAVAPYAEDMSGQWYQVTAQSGQRGWVSASYLSRKVPARVAPAPAPAALGESSASAAAASRAAASNSNYSGSKYRTVTISSGTLNIRSAPSTRAGVVGSLAKGASVQVLSEHAGWVKVATRSGEGYVASRYLR